jgi:hypothetical protein
VPRADHAAAGVEPRLAALDGLASLPLCNVVASHGQMLADRSSITQPRRSLQGLDRSFSTWAGQGWDMNEALRGPVPAELRGWAAFGPESVRIVAHLHPTHEKRVVPAAAGAPK